MASKQPVFRIGFTGSTLDGIVPWEVEQVGAADTVVMAMAGSGKDIAALAREGRTIYSWDPQELSRCVVQGVFGAPAGTVAPLERGALRGYATTEHPMTGMPESAALLADWVAEAGTDYDRVCLAQSLIRSSFMGRLAAWARDATEDTLWDAYLRNHAKFMSWRGLPGRFVHTKGSVFADPAHLHQLVKGATLFVDTPKVVNTGKHGDIYSKGFLGLNSILAQERQTLPPWTEDTFRREMPILWTAPWDRMLLFHATGCRPEPVDVLAAMLADGVPFPTSVGSWTHKGRTDVCWVCDRDGDPFWV